MTQRLRGRRAAALGALVVTLVPAACSSSGAARHPAATSSPTIGTTTTSFELPAAHPQTVTPALSAPARAALLQRATTAVDELVRGEASLPVVIPRQDGSGHDHMGMAMPLDPDPVRDRQLADARAAAQQWLTVPAAEAAGYVRGNGPETKVPGSGFHFIRWDLLTKPFDPANPAMLLFAPLDPAHPEGEMRLVAFSYFLRSPRAPDGFHGDGDMWHQHHGLCLDAALLVEKESVPPAECSGHWLNGADLWMLHAWVLPDVPNRWGVFAAMNPDLCNRIPGCGDNPLPPGADL